MKGLKIFFYSLVAILYLLMLLNGIYLALPTELQESIGFLSPVSAVVGGTAFGSVATAILYLDRRFTNKEMKQDSNHTELIKAFMDYVSRNKGDLTQVIKGQNKLTKEVERNNRLLEADLNAKLSNELIDGKAKELIEGVLNEK